MSGCQPVMNEQELTITSFLELLTVALTENCSTNRQFGIRNFNYVEIIDSQPKYKRYGTVINEYSQPLFFGKDGDPLKKTFNLGIIHKSYIGELKDE